LKQMLDEIYGKLKSVGLPVEYGVCTKEYEAWDYIVYGRKSVGRNARNYTNRFFVAIVRENYIPENFDVEVIEKLEEIPGLKLTKGEQPYEYTKKKNTDSVIEICVLEFAKEQKKGC